MHQMIALALTLIVAVLLNGGAAAQMISAGYWGGAIGSLLFGPLIVFYVVHTLVYFVVRLIRGKDRVRSYTRSRLNYVAAVVAILGVVGAAAGPA
jgi:heme/copper-type cytochrome/quinol oxidase subunit 2